MCGAHFCSARSNDQFPDGRFSSFSFVIYAGSLFHARPPLEIGFAILNRLAVFVALLTKCIEWQTNTRLAHVLYVC